jgi:hypothetical protein
MLILGKILTAARGGSMFFLHYFALITTIVVQILISERGLFNPWKKGGSE